MMRIRDEWGEETGMYPTLRIARGSFLEWWFPRTPEEAGQEVSRHERLTSRDRQLVVSLDTNHMAWVAMNKGQLTQFATSLRPDGKVVCGGEAVTIVEVDLLPNPAKNVSFVVSWAGGGPVRFIGRFDGDRLDLALDSKTMREDAVEPYEARLRSNKRVLEDALLRLMLEPFKFERNRSGQRASRFLDAPPGTAFEVRCRELPQGRYLTVARAA